MGGIAKQDPEHILPSVSPLFIAFSLFTALVLNLLPWGHWAGIPDFVALVLIFWGVYQPNRIGISVAFGMGLLMDVSNAMLLGENALVYTLLSYFTITLHRRILWFPLMKQAWYILFLLLSSQLIQMLLQFIVSGRMSSWFYLLDSCVGALLWPLVTVILLTYQRRSSSANLDRSL